MELYRRNIKPLHQRIVDVAKANDVPVMVHTCGSSSWAYEDFIEMGIRAVETLQPEAGPRNYSWGARREFTGGGFFE